MNTRIARTSSVPDLAPVPSDASDVEEALSQFFSASDDAGFDPLWGRGLEQAQALALRPAKRTRPLLFLLGHALGLGRFEPNRELVRMSAALELLHTFMLIHDDVADQAALRRGGPALHHELAPGRRGEDLAVVVGDHLFARAIEALLEAPFPRAPEVARYLLKVCRHTAVGQYLDLELTQASLSEVSVFQVLKVARLKTARYGLVAPLVAGALLGGGSPTLLASLDRVGTSAGLAYQLRDDLLGLFGDARATGKDGGSDFEQRKRTFPVLAAWARAGASERSLLQHLWGPEGGRPEQLEEARALVRRCGGERVTERVVARTTRAARRALDGITDDSGALRALDQLLTSLAHRTA